MIISYEKIASLNEVNFDYLFIESFSRLDTNFLWYKPDLTFSDKKEFYLNQLQSAIEGKFPLEKDGDRFFMYKTLLDGEEKELSAGFIGIDGSYRGHWNLSASDTLGSRNWMYTKEARDARKILFNSNGAYSYTIFTFIGSDLYKFIKYRRNAGNFNIIEEKPTLPGINPQNLVTLIISI